MTESDEFVGLGFFVPSRQSGGPTQSETTMTVTPVRLSHHDPRWRQEFEQTRSGILQACEGRVTDIEHIGGTALSGAICQPVVDLLVGVTQRTELQEAASAIEGLFLRRLPSSDFFPASISLVKPRSGEATHHVYLMTIGDPGWHDAIRLRDGLRNNPELLIEFEESKVEVWKDCEGDRDRYEADKRVLLNQFSAKFDQA